MTDENKNLPGGGIRRVSHKDRKKQLKSTWPLFPISNEDTQNDPVPENPSSLLASKGDPMPPLQETPLAASQAESPAPASGVAPEDEREAAKRLMREIVQDVVSTLPPLATPPQMTLERQEGEGGDEYDETVVADIDFSTLKPAARPLPPPMPAAPKVDNPNRYPSLNPVAPPELPTVAPAPRRSFFQQNLIALAFILTTVAAIAYFVYIWQNPYSPLNPLAPPTPFIVITETPVVAIGVNPATEAASLVESTPIPGPTNTPVDAGGFPFALSDSGVVYVPNTNANGCNWASIAGSVTGLQGEPLDNYGVQMTDVEDPSRLDVKIFSGSALSVGAGGFELSLGGNPVARTYTVQLFTATGAPVSRVFEITTRESCEENVAIINFVQVEAF